MRPFEILEPATLHEAIALLDPEDTNVRPIAGGTALMLMMKSGLFRPARLVSLRCIGDGLSGAQTGAAGELRIGALTTLSTLEYSPAVRRGAPVIAETLRTLSNIRVRNVATVGGHLAHADPHMDLPPVLIALGASIRIAGPAGERTIPVEALFTGYYETVLERNEIIAELIVPPQEGRRAAYLKCTTRSADDWPALGVAVSVDVKDDWIRSARIAIGAATNRPTRLAHAESMLSGAPGNALLRRAGEAAADEAEVLADTHGSAAYKKQLVRVHVERALRKALVQS